MSIIVKIRISFLGLLTLGSVCISVSHVYKCKVDAVQPYCVAQWMGAAESGVAKLSRFQWRMRLFHAVVFTSQRKSSYEVWKAVRQNRHVIEVSVVTACLTAWLHSGESVLRSACHWTRKYIAVFTRGGHLSLSDIDRTFFIFALFVHSHS
jgi:hypothetical protein